MDDRLLSEMAEKLADWLQDSEELPEFDARVIKAGDPGLKVQANVPGMVQFARDLLIYADQANNQWANGEKKPVFPDDPFEWAEADIDEFRIDNALTRELPPPRKGFGDIIGFVVLMLGAGIVLALVGIGVGTVVNWLN